MKKRFTRLLAMGIASLMAVSLAACGSSSSGSAGQTAGADSTVAANAGNGNVKTIKFWCRLKTAEYAEVIFPECTQKEHTIFLR